VLIITDIFKLAGNLLIYVLHVILFSIHINHFHSHRYGEGRILQSFHYLLKNYVNFCQVNDVHTEFSV